ncbi:hypothetical protein CCAX7_40040 [Capsulimonas corticalis]|uniref:Uncharacterized protein n=1 Tax=Capsulimonas corticalis TaxID=2219043 RepID=A0A402D4X0_9BACT|nr:GxGYxYP domain-containing protein [Capsulimonas corticalis]BDI31953.1 hypothetical protein CCAX7_40040 [Capsulimonas corticalis]
MNKRWPSISAVLLLSSTAALTPMSAFAADALADAPRAAVMLQTDFPVFGVTGRVSPKAIAANLTAAGVPADLLDAKALADSGRLNAKRYAVVVLPYGNNFPKAAFANLQDFHHAGGSFVLTGIPFTHPIQRVKDKKGNESWSDMGHNHDAALFGPDGIGVGGFTEPSEQDTSLAASDPLGLKVLGRTWSGRTQMMDPSTLPAEDQVIPILVQGTLPVAAMIVHNDAAYKGAVDVWTTHPDTGDLEAYDTEQMITRGVVAILAQKNLLPADRVQTAFDSLTNIPKPKQYANLELPTPPRPYETFQPRSNPPAEHLYVADVRKIKPEERLLLSSLQGIVNRKQPRIYLLFRDSDVFWLKQLQAQGTTGSTHKVKNPLSLLKIFKDDFQGAVVTDPNVYVTPHVAVDIAGLEDQVIATPELAQRLKLDIKTDLRGRFKDDADAYKYVRTELLPRLNPYLSISLDAPLDSGAIDQIIQARGLALWVTGPKEQEKPGANENAEVAEIEAMFAQLPLNAVVRGYWYSGGDSNGLDEGPGVSLASRFGKVTVVSDYVSNFSVFSGAPAKTRTQKRNPAPAFDPTKVYVAVTVSDGDNLCTWQNNFQDYFNDPLHGTFPIGWGMGPTLLDCAPNMVQWYYDHATPNDEFFCDVSGVGYIYPPDWAKSLKDRDGALSSFFGWTAKYMDMLDMKTIRHMNVRATDIAEMGRELPNTKFFVPDYGYAGEKGYDAITYPLPTGQTVFRTITDGNPREMAAQIKNRVGDRRPAFVNAFIVNWGNSLKDIKKGLDDLGPGYVAVTPSQLNDLYNQAKGK